jgi:glyoxylase-like metal-dependent hydrolase (beta-lactamase superfamily II)
MSRAVGTVGIELRQSGIWQTNSVVLDGGAGGCVVVDPAFFPRELDELAAIARARGGAAAVVFTHGHWDHVAGWRHFPGAAVYGSARLQAAIAANDESARRNLAQLRDFDGRWYVERGAPLAWPPAVAALVGAARIAGVALEPLALPGHSDDGLALMVPELGLLLPGDHLSPCEIPFVEDHAAYRATLGRLLALLARVERVIPGHGRPLTSDEARAIAEADLAYLEALAACAVRGDRAAAEAVPLPRAVDVPGMREHHLDNVRTAFSV